MDKVDLRACRDFATATCRKDLLKAISRKPRAATRTESEKTVESASRLHDRARMQLRNKSEVFARDVGATRGRTNRVRRKRSRIQACVQSLFPDSPGVLSNERV